MMLWPSKPAVHLVLRTANVKRREVGNFEVLLHSDAAQAVGKIPVDVNDLGVDYLTVAGHKFYGPRIGALYRRANCPLSPVGTGYLVEKIYQSLYYSPLHYIQGLKP